MIKLDGFTSHDSSDAVPVGEQDRQRLADKLIELVERGDMPYRATVVATGDCFLLAMQLEGTDAIEIYDCRKVSAHFKTARAARTEGR